jgi:hypothetical protein
MEARTSQGLSNQESWSLRGPLSASDGSHPSKKLPELYSFSCDKPRRFHGTYRSLWKNSSTSASTISRQPHADLPAIIPRRRRNGGTKEEARPWSKFLSLELAR